MAIQFKWEGVFPALLTPFTADDYVDYQMFGKNLDAQIAAGVAGVIIGGKKTSMDITAFNVERYN
jgi:4-hydroxy-tetrahydrodipicolinate synthase